SPALVEKTLNQIEAQAIPENHPAIPALNRLFGDHTFFLDNNGLHIVEPVASDEQGMQSGNVVKLASWNDAERTSLAAHAPQPTNETSELGSDKSQAIHEAPSVTDVGSARSRPTPRARRAGGRRARHRACCARGSSQQCAATKLLSTMRDASSRSMPPIH